MPGSVFDGVLLPRLPQGWLTERSAHHVQEPNPQAVDQFCHQCRRTDNPRPRYLCGRAACVRAFCTGCLERRYKWTQYDIHLRGCPVCRRVCNCSKCLAVAGLRLQVKPMAALVRRGGTCPREWLEQHSLLVERTETRRETPMPAGNLHGVNMTPKTQLVDGGRGSIYAWTPGQDELELRSPPEDNALDAQVRGRKRRWSARDAPPPARAMTTKKRAEPGPSTRLLSPRIIVISSDCEDDDYPPRSTSSRHRITMVRQPTAAHKRAGALMHTHDLTDNTPDPGAEPRPQEGISLFDYDHPSPSTIAGARTVQSRGIVEESGSAETSARPTATSAASPKPPIAFLAQHRKMFASKYSNVALLAADDVIEISDSGSDGSGFVMPLRKDTKFRKPLHGPPSAPSAFHEPPALEVVGDAAQGFYLSPLLRECGQQALYTFDSFLEVFRLDELHARAEPSTMVYRKLSEASFSEVYAIGDVVLKVVPLRSGEWQAEGEVEDAEEWCAPEKSGVRDLLREIRITRELSAVCPGFVELLKAYVVCGTYPEQLLTQWDEYDDRRKSGSIRPDSFPASQAYGVLVLPNLGTDLEAFAFKAGSGWSQASAIFWQVAQTLCTAEQRVQFEHRDLHWGQVLVRDDGAGGVRATVIDLGLSRMQASAGNAPLWAPIDDEVLDGQGDYQFTIYRMMRDHNAGDWEAFRPLTNVMWMHYLAMKLTQEKKLHTPTTVAERNCARGLLDAQQLLASSIAAASSRGDAANKTSHVLCVADLVAWADERGWMRMAF